MKGYKVFKPDFTSKHNNYKFAENTEFKHEGPLEICSTGFHFSVKAAHCFAHYEFDPQNVVCEVEARGQIISHPTEEKHCTDILFVGKRLTWHEVLVVANDGDNNTGHSNSGDRNSGNWNSGNWNSGNSNSGDRNSGNWNSGDWNSGNWNSGNWNSGDWNSGNSNSGDRNSGNWNSGDRNSGDSNSGYRNSGAFCIDDNPYLILFDKPTKIRVRDWENHPACNLMYNIDPTIWVPASMMNDKEKQHYPKYETTDGYLKTIPMKEAWANMWGNLTDENKLLFTSLENFDAKIFEQITGIKI